MRPQQGRGGGKRKDTTGLTPEQQQKATAEGQEGQGSSSSNYREEQTAGETGGKMKT